MVGLASNASAADDLHAARTATHTGVPAELARFIERYLRVMHSPGLTLALATRADTEYVASFGYSNLDRRSPLPTTDRFQIGSLSKSFVALMILQLQDEGKLDVQHSVLRYLPWLPIETAEGEIRIHHLLIHAAGMPANTQVNSCRSGRRLRPSFAPGSHFHYCNWGYDVLGRLIEKIEAAPFSEVLVRRILGPLQMHDTAPVIATADSRLVMGYQPRYDDRPYPQDGELVPAPILTFDRPAGSIASTPRDMARYMRMLLNRGVGPAGRLVSQEGFEHLATGYIDAPLLGPQVRYGYGIGVDEFDGHKRLRHTGGLPSFASAMHLDLDAGVGAFASINAQQGFRPEPVVEYAIRLSRGGSARNSPIPVPSIEQTLTAAQAADYTGIYTAADGRQVEVVQQQSQLILVNEGNRIALRPWEKDQFIAQDSRFSLFPVVFGRSEASAASAPEKLSGQVADLSYGQDWYSRGHSAPVSVVQAAPELRPFEGFYYAGSTPALSGAKWIVQRRGRLWLNGVIPLESLGAAGLFRIGDDPRSPETAEFQQLVDGKAQLFLLSGEPLRRTERPFPESLTLRLL